MLKFSLKTTLINFVINFWTIICWGSMNIKFLLFICWCFSRVLNDINEREKYIIRAEFIAARHSQTACDTKLLLCSDPADNKFNYLLPNVPKLSGNVPFPIRLRCTPLTRKKLIASATKAGDCNSSSYAHLCCFSFLSCCGQ